MSNVLDDLAPIAHRCAAPFCRTTVLDEDAIYCPHGVVTCGDCPMEHACEECDT